ncbi:hypothetical protein B0H11DRAFT_8618 [Mycena galericulata]|nr:hypothetical protein B0H11DRAFT_8618 [Mycena galericulata]
MFLSLRILIYTISFLASYSTALSFPTSLPTQLIFQSPDSLFLENIAVRFSGELLLTSVMSPTLHMLNPFSVNATLDAVHTFDNSTAITGIAEYQPGIFAMVTSVLNTTIGRAALGSVAVWSVDFNSAVPVVHKIGALPESRGPNGLTSVPDEPDVLLAADSAAGAVWQINTRTGASHIAIQDPAMSPTISSNETVSALVFGINGLHVHGRFLYFANSQLGTFSRVPLKIENGAVMAAGSVQQLATIGSVDDFAIDSQGRAWVAVHPGALSLVFPVAGGSWTQLDVVGNSQGNNSILIQPTSAAFGRGNLLQTQMLYVTTGVGQVVRVNTTEQGGEF